MAEYRIVAKIDPAGVVTGRAKVEQELRGLEASADKTKRSLEGGVAQPLGKAGVAARDFNREMNSTSAGMGRARDMFARTSVSVTDLSNNILKATRPIQNFTSATAGTGGAGASGGAAGAVGLLRTGASLAAGVVGGIFGAALASGAAQLVDFAFKALKGKESLDDMVDALRKEAQEQEQNRQAKIIYGVTLDGVKESIEANKRALDELAEADKTAARRALETALADQDRIASINAVTSALLKQAEAQYTASRSQTFGAAGGAGAGMAQSIYAGNVEDIRRQQAEIDAQQRQADANVREALSRRIVEIAQETSTAEGSINRQYDRRIELKRQELVAQKATVAEIAKQTRLLEDQRNAELKAARDAKKDPPKARAVSDGVARFRSREQAIGIAGRELQGQGLRVDGNKQFGVTSGHANDADHNKYAIDVNVGKGTTEANVPDLKAKFDRLALSYQKRGYNVIWNGQKYNAFGNGPSGPAKGHTNHLHLYAPGTIVGQETMASTAAQEAREYSAAETLNQQKDDFVQQIADRSAGRGQTDDVQSELDRVLADYKRRFNEEMSPEQRKKVTDAITSAEAREIARDFDEAYVKPLKRLSDLQGTTGLSREILNAQLEESVRLRRALTPEEAKQIENAYRMGDAQERQTAILSSIRQPIEDYKAQIAALNALLDAGQISQQKFNYEVSNLGMQVASREQGIGLGTTSETDAAEQEILAEQARERDLAAQFYAAGIISHDEFERRKSEITRRESAARITAERSVATARLQMAQSISNDLLAIAEASVGKQNAVYKALFVASKAFAIAEAVIKIQQGIANALALPFPANIPAIASVTAAAASIVSSIQSVALNLADGGQVGLVRGPGGPRADKIPANLSDQEYVMPAAAVARPGNKALLDAMRQGAVGAGLRRGRADTTASRQMASGDTVSLQFGDVVVHTGSNTTAEDGQSIGRDVKTALSELVDERLAEAMRPGGKLTRSTQSVMA